MNITKELSDSLLWRCKAAGIKEPKYIAQDKSGHVYHYNVKPTLASFEWLEVISIRLNHQPYADDWRESLLVWVEPQGEPLASVLARHPDHIADTSKKVDDACKIAYRKHIDNGNGTCWSRADCYRAAWQDALAWKGGDDD